MRKITGKQSVGLLSACAEVLVQTDWPVIFGKSEVGPAVAESCQRAVTPRKSPWGKLIQITHA
jgi:hypothetical protein